MVPSIPPEIPHKLRHPGYKEVNVLGVTAYRYVLHGVIEVESPHLVWVYLLKGWVAKDTKVTESLLHQLGCRKSPGDTVMFAVFLNPKVARQHDGLSGGMYLFRSFCSLHFATLCFMVKFNTNHQTARSDSDNMW